MVVIEHWWWTERESEGERVRTLSSRWLAPGNSTDIHYVALLAVCYGDYALHRNILIVVCFWSTYRRVRELRGILLK